MKVAMVGVSHPHSTMYLETLELIDEVAGIFLCDPDSNLAQAVATSFPKTVDIVPSLDSLLEHSDVGHAIVAVPTDQSVPTLMRLIQSGRHVLAEKPAARSAEEFVGVVEACREASVKLGFAYLNRWHPAIQRIRELFEDGAIGTLTSVELRMVTTQVQFRDPRHWLFQRDVAGGGILSWLGCHLLDLIRYLTSEEISTVAAVLATTSGEKIDVEDTAAVSMQLSGGAIATLHAGYLLASGAAGYRGAAYDRAILLRGTEGAISYSFDGPVRLESVADPWRRAARQSYTFELPSTPGYGGVHGVEYVRSLLTVEPQDLTIAGPDDALHVLAVLDAIYEANRSGGRTEVVRFPSVTEPFIKTRR